MTEKENFTVSELVELNLFEACKPRRSNILLQSVLQYFCKEILSSIVTKGTDFFLQPSRCNKTTEFLSHWAKLLAQKIFATNLGALGFHPVIV